MTRWRASGTHLLITLVVMASVAAWVVAFWYPPALFKMAGFDRLLFLLAVIDLVAGPFLTLLIYRHGKSGLKFDLTVIGVVQAALLAYGLSVIWASRPVFMVAVHDRIDVVFANQINPAELERATNPAWRKLTIASPRLVGAKAPDDPELATEALFAALAGRDIPLRPQYYIEFEDIAPTLAGNAKRIEEAGSPALEKALRAKVEALGRIPETLRFVPIASKRGFATMLIDASSGQPVAAIDADPYEQ